MKTTGTILCSKLEEYQTVDTPVNAPVKTTEGINVLQMFARSILRSQATKCKYTVFAAILPVRFL